MKVILSAYACEPGKGSEPGVGWKWANGLAGRVDLDVLTRESNRAVIEAAVGGSVVGSPLRSVRFHYHDLSAPFLWLKKRRILPTMGYYFLWQWSVARKFRSLAESTDIVHHLTFCTLLCPGFWKLRKAAFVVGPVGAPLVNPHYIGLFGGGAPIQRLRGLVMNRFLHLPWLKKMLTNAAAVFPANSETRELLNRHGIATREVMLDTGAPDPAPLAGRTMKDGACRFLYAGVLERRKGLELALRAFAKALEGEAAPNIRFGILGNGPDRGRLESLAGALGIADRVDFMGAVPQAEVARRFAEADVFVFTSVRDTSAGVNLEAMAAGLPVLCLAHQGVADITDDSCAVRVPPAAIGETIHGLSVGMERLAKDPALRQRLGENARTRAMEGFSWEEKFVRMVGVYESIG
jgi:glycosyltransferase involved in cell wall biosynthesis